MNLFSEAIPKIEQLNFLEQAHEGDKSLQDVMSLFENQFGMKL